MKTYNTGARFKLEVTPGQPPQLIIIITSGAPSQYIGLTFSVPPTQPPLTQAQTDQAEYEQVAVERMLAMLKAKYTPEHIDAFVQHLTRKYHEPWWFSYIKPQQLNAYRTRGTIDYAEPLDFEFFDRWSLIDDMEEFLARGANE